MPFVAFKRFGQALGVFAEILVQRHQVHQLGIKAGLAFYAFFPGAGNFRLKSLKLLGKRRQQRRKRGFLLGGKRLVLSFDDFVGNVLKFQRQFFFYLFQIADFSAIASSRAAAAAFCALKSRSSPVTAF